MDLPDALILERFRSFSARAVVPLRPLTLVYGANSSGKSAVLRALALLSASLEAAPRGALTLPDRVFPGVRPRDLPWQGRAGDYRFRLGLQWKNAGIEEFVATMNPTAEGDAPLSDLEVTRRGSAPWRARGDLDGGALVDPDTGGALPFEGLLPAQEAHALADLRAQLTPLRGRVRWLASVRAPVPRLIEPKPDRGLFSDGEEVPQLLVADADLRERVAAFYGKLDPARSLELHPSPPLGHYFSMNPPTRPTWRVRLGDTGEGMSQVLPVLAYAALTARNGGIFAVEEPESHLHPSAQSRLADFLCDLTREAAAPRFVVETHSRVLLLAVQRAVAAGFPADDVQIVWTMRGTAR